MWVLKIGGSLMFGAELRAWLAAIVEHGGGRVAIVPGGGAFADVVRRAQAHQGYADTTAHAMALLAMAQYGLMMTGIEERLSAADGPAEMRAALAAGRVPVWIPRADGAPGLCESWAVSSDSLALWIAGQIGATDLGLVKSREPYPGAHRAQDLSALGILDTAFPGSLARAALEAWWFGRTDHRSIAPIVLHTVRPRTRVF